MKTTLSKFLILLQVAILASPSAWAVKKLDDDLVRIGKPAAANKTIEFNKGSGTANPKIRWNNAGSQLEFSLDGSTWISFQAAAGQMPVGAVIAYAGSTCPTGFIPGDGANLLRAGTYAALFTAIGTLHGTLDGTHFNAPDLRGRFPRGSVLFASKNFATTDVNTGTDAIAITNHGINRSGFPIRFTTTTTLPGGLAAGTTYWSIYVDANTFKVASTEANAITGTQIDITSQGTGTHTVAQYMDPDAGTRTAGAAGGTATADAVGSVQADEFMSHTHTVPRSSGDVNGGGSRLTPGNNPSGDQGSSASGGNETRGKNISMLYCVRYQ